MIRVPKKRDTDLTDAELAAWKASRRLDGTPIWPAHPTWREYQEWVCTLGWRAAACRQADRERAQKRKGVGV
jgi:hypothetical protein